MRKIKILIADDHTIFLDGIASLLEKEKDIEIIGKAENGIKALQILETTETDLVILDLSMPEMDGVELVKNIQKKYPNIKTLVVSTHSNTQIISRLMRLGINGYLLKNTDAVIFLQAIHEIVADKNYFADEISEKHLNNCIQLEKQTTETVELSNREKEILTLVAQGFTAAEIAEKAFISLNTVNTHRQNLLSKLNAKNLVGLVKYAIENGYVD
ncbi:response regulator transcription factor [Flavobacterium adhaerens]|uniref:response regulator transcription factor n=1 Tax=Flavobacterium adhaerens TaxID=3149043 RepID=UPI0032B61F36